MRRIALERSALQDVLEESLAERDGLLGRHLADSFPLPHLPRRLYDERARVGRELVRVRLEPPRVRLRERKGEGVESSRGAEPDVSTAADVGVRPVRGGVPVADGAVDSVRCDDDIDAVPFDTMLERVGRLFLLVDDMHTEFPAALLEDRKSGV